MRGRLLMARRKKENKAELVKETEQVLVFKANRPMRETEFKLLSELVRHEEEKNGVKIVLLPHSADLVEVKEVEKEQTPGTTENEQTETKDEKEKE
jgi:hypothetical protein